MSMSGSSSTYVAPGTTAGVQGSPNQGNVGIAQVVSVTRSATLGDHLVASNGMTLYRYTKDTKGVSNCYTACAVTWPPYMSTIQGPLGAGATGTIATIARTDGGQQITYNGVPLYYFKTDAKVGDTLGQNVGGIWFVVKP